MQQPRGFEDKDHPDYICKLDRALYGMKQASLVWYRMVAFVMKHYELLQHSHDQCVFYRIDDDGKWLVVLVFVDDIFVDGDDDLIDGMVKHLRRRLTESTDSCCSSWQESHVSR